MLRIVITRENALGVKNEVSDVLTTQHQSRDEETAACVDEAHRHGVRLCAHARARDSVKMCVRHGVDIIYHASWIDDEVSTWLHLPRPWNHTLTASGNGYARKEQV
jgi:imidazolonepropionase-like amidohydrolase